MIKVDIVKRSFEDRGTSPRSKPRWQSTRCSTRCGRPCNGASASSFADSASSRSSPASAASAATPVPARKCASLRAARSVSSRGKDLQKHRLDLDPTPYVVWQPRPKFQDRVLAARPALRADARHDHPHRGPALRWLRRRFPRGRGLPMPFWSLLVRGLWYKRHHSSRSSAATSSATISPAAIMTSMPPCRSSFRCRRRS